MRLFGQPETLKIRQSEGQILFFFAMFCKDRATGRLRKLREVCAKLRSFHSLCKLCYS